MNITKQNLKKIIEEELTTLLKEQRREPIGDPNQWYPRRRRAPERSTRVGRGRAGPEQRRGPERSIRVGPGRHRPEEPLPAGFWTQDETDAKGNEPGDNIPDWLQYEDGIQLALKWDVERAEALMRDTEKRAAARDIAAEDRKRLLFGPQQVSAQTSLPVTPPPMSPVPIDDKDLWSGSSYFWGPQTDAALKARGHVPFTPRSATWAQTLMHGQPMGLYQSPLFDYDLVKHGPSALDKKLLSKSLNQSPYTATRRPGHLPLDYTFRGPRRTSRWTPTAPEQWRMAGIGMPALQSPVMTKEEAYALADADMPAYSPWLNRSYVPFRRPEATLNNPPLPRYQLRDSAHYTTRPWDPDIDPPSRRMSHPALRTLDVNFARSNAAREADLGGYAQLPIEGPANVLYDPSTRGPANRPAKWEPIRPHGGMSVLVPQQSLARQEDIEGETMHPLAPGLYRENMQSTLQKITKEELTNILNEKMWDPIKWANEPTGLEAEDPRELGDPADWEFEEDEEDEESKVWQRLNAPWEFEEDEEDEEWTPEDIEGLQSKWPGHKITPRARQDIGRMMRSYFPDEPAEQLGIRAVPPAHMARDLPIWAREPTRTGTYSEEAAAEAAEAAEEAELAEVDPTPIDPETGLDFKMTMGMNPGSYEVVFVLPDHVKKFKFNKQWHFHNQKTGRIYKVPKRYSGNTDPTPLSAYDR